MKRIFVAIHPARDVRVVWYDERTRKLGSILFDADKGLYDQLENFIAQHLYYRRTKSIHIDYQMPKYRTAEKKVSVVNRLPGQNRHAYVPVRGVDKAIPGAIVADISFSTLRFDQVRRCLKLNKQGYWLISRGTWQRWHGFHEIFNSDITNHEIRLVHKFAAKARFPYFKGSLKVFAPALLVLAWAMDRKECYFDFGSGKKIRVF
jgi:hypothetical protein